MANKAKIWCTSAWDKMELLHGEFDTHVFPWHTHETYCISLIEKGTELGRLTDRNFAAKAGSIIIIKPGELHSNQSLDNNSYQLRTFYINSDVMSSFLNWGNSEKNSIHFSDHVIYDQELFASLLLSHKQLQVSDIAKPIEKDFSKAINLLVHKYGLNKNDNEDTRLNQWFTDFLDYVDNHIDERIPLDLLAEKFGIDKFKFIRLFKRQFGLAPVEFIIQRKIEFAKHKLKNGTSLVSTALNTGFYDQSHFTNYFKKYVGVTPLAYKKACNILQD